MRGNGERIGPQNLPTSSIAGGIWNLLNQQRAQQRGAWPSATPAVVTDPYFMYVPLLLNTTSTNGQQNNTFLDSSTNNFTITRNGTPTQGSFTPYQPSGYWSGYFPSTSGNYATISSTPISATTTTFTIESWIFPTATASGTYPIIIGDANPTAAVGYFLFGTTSANNLQLFWFDGAAKTCTGNTTISLNTWTHIAVSVNSNAISLYVNGIQQTLTGTTTLTNRSGTTGGYVIAQYNNGASIYTGYISNLSVLNGTAKYNSAFTPSTTPLSTSTTNQTLLACSSNRFIDSNTATTAKTITVFGSSSIQAFQPFSPAASYSAATYGGSGYFNGTTDYLTAASNAAFRLETNTTWTWETWVYPTALNAAMVLSGNTTNGSSNGHSIYLASGLLRIIQFGVSNFASSATAKLNQWNHLAIVCNSGTATFYLNGTSSGSISWGSGTAGGTLFVGSYFGADPFPGWISGTRYQLGVAQVPPAGGPTSPVTATANTSLLLGYTNAGIYDAAWQNNALTVGDAQVSTTQKQWGTTSMRFDGTGDYLNVITAPALNLSGSDFTIEAWIYLSSIAATGSIVSKYVVSNVGASEFLFWITSTGAIGFAIDGGGGEDYIASSAGTFATGSWYYVAVTRSGTGTNNVKLWQNGTQVAQGTSTRTMNVTSTALTVGSIGASNYFNGYIQDLRITKGVARTITTPTAAFPTR